MSNRRAASAQLSPCRDTNVTASTLNSLVNARRFDMNFAPHASQYALRCTHAKRGKVQLITILVNGGSDNDTLYGGSGNDKIVGQAGIDSVFGEAGIDRIAGGSGFGKDTGDVVTDLAAEIDEAFTIGFDGLRFLF